MLVHRYETNSRRARCAHSNFVSSGHVCTRLCNAAWECPPSRGRATDAPVGSVELPGHVQPRLTYSIRVVFHIDTTRSEAAFRPDRAVWTVRTDCKGALGRRAGPGVRRSGPRVWVGPNARELGCERERWAGSTATWAGRAGTGPNLRVRRSGKGVRRPLTAVPASGRRGDGTGGGGEHCLGYAVLGGSVTRLGSVGIEEIFGISARFSSFPTMGFWGLIAENPGGSRGGNEGVLFGVRSRVCFRGEIGAGSRDLRAERGKAAGEASSGVSGERVSGGRQSRWVGDRGVLEMTEGLQ
ncbi:hypothetical protein CRG98_014373 [Punica granatum]|uniref:Uncharacterized protein n=1 Tax=Punica granatum TaxID=22663 RepID=A0A2I0K9L8_PUNGR|nr:hypothetical protein CRG98_014373 [Punica granatum]